MYDSMVVLLLYISDMLIRDLLLELLKGFAGTSSTLCAVVLRLAIRCTAVAAADHHQFAYRRPIHVPMALDFIASTP